MQTISTIAIELPVLVDADMPRLDAWLRKVCWETQLPKTLSGPDSDQKEPFEIHRLKGRIIINTGRTMILQGVREIFELTNAPNEGDDTLVEDAKSKIVIIGRRLELSAFQKSIEFSITSGRQAESQLV